MDALIAYVLNQAGLDADAYRPQPLHRRLPACLRLLKVDSTDCALAILKQQRELLAPVVNSLLIGVTEFFREPGVFDYLRAHILPELAQRRDPLRIWSAACSSGAELYSVAMLLDEANLLSRCLLLGTDCRADAVAQAQAGVYDAATVRLVPPAMRTKYFERQGMRLTPIATLRRRTHWKMANLLSGVEAGPWDIILWRNASIYLNPRPAEAIWRRLASALSPEGALIVGRAERPPKDAGLTRIDRQIYRRSHCVETTRESSMIGSLPIRSSHETSERK